MTPARKAAFEILLKMQKDHAYSNLTLEHHAALPALDARDRAFVSALVYGVTERRLTLDNALRRHLTKPLSRLKPEAVCLLRLGAYQLLFMEKVPVSAAVNETVQLAKMKCPYASGIVNAVLRKIAAEGLVLPDETAPEFLSVKYSCPQWLIDQWTADYGREAAVGILEASLQPAAVTVRVNTVLTAPQSLKHALEAEGVVCEPCGAPELLRLKELPCAVDQLSAFRAGLFHVQDEASFLCAKAVGAKPGETVFDLCSAPGGKAFSVAEWMENRGKVLAFDLYEARVRLIEQGAKRLGLSVVHAAVQDASVRAPIGPADRVLCDVPCSGLGIIRRKPEIKYKPQESLETLPQLQLSILENGASYVKPGGRLIYSTCALSKKENEDVCAAFLKRAPNFLPVAALPQQSTAPFLTLFPHRDGCDGFFIAAFEKRGER